MNQRANSYTVSSSLMNQIATWNKDLCLLMNECENLNKDVRPLMTQRATWNKDLSL